MKKFRKLVPALCMLLISAVLLGTSTFAWFSMNTTVTATGMQVTAKTNHTYLLISKTDDKTTLQTNPTAADTTVDLNATKQLFPAAHETFTSGTDAATVGNWFTAQGKDPSKADMKDDTKTTLSTFENYVLKQTVYITVTSDSADANNLKVSAEINDGTYTNVAPVKILVVCGEKYVELDSTKLTDDTALADSISGSALTQVDIYIYYDGSHADVTTNKAASLAGASVVLTFSVDQ